jgi:hypothetical protein
MKELIAAIVVLPILVFVANAQPLTNTTIKERIRAARAERDITLTFDPQGKTSKLMAVAGNFAGAEAKRSGLMAMNFAVGHIYPGNEMSAEPQSFLFTFWVLSKKPRFSEEHAMTVVLPEEMLVIGSGRYASRPAEQVEYLNFEISRENLMKIARQIEVGFMLGDERFTFTHSQMKLLADLLTVTAVDLK